MNAYDDIRLESFLLDELASAEREEIEQRIFVDDELFSRVEEMETDLVDAYVAVQLPGDLRERFERALVSNPARKEKVVFAKILRERTVADAEDAERDVLPFARRHPVAFGGVLAAAVVGIVIGAALLIGNDGETPGTQPSQVAAAPDNGAPGEGATAGHHPTATDSAATTETPLMALERPPVPTIVNAGQEGLVSRAAHTTTFVLSTVTMRSGTDLNVLEVAENVTSVRMQLVLESDEFPSYNVDIRNASGTSVWSATRLPVRTIDGGPALSFEMPARTLSSGWHEVVLAGVNESGTEEVAYVDFEVATLP